MERRHPKLDRITYDPAKCAGKACIRGMRITAEAIVSYLASGMTTEELLAEYGAGPGPALARRAERH